MSRKEGQEASSDALAPKTSSGAGSSGLTNPVTASLGSAQLGLGPLGGNWTWGFIMELASQMTSNYFTGAARAQGVDVEYFTTLFGSHTYALF